MIYRSARECGDENNQSPSQLPTKKQETLCGFESFRSELAPFERDLLLQLHNGKLPNPGQTNSGINTVPTVPNL